MSIMWTTMQPLNNPSIIPKVQYGLNPFYLTQSRNASVNLFEYTNGSQY
uniref:Uncharacterized protein n=1 Tax=Acrobeloides nanus TaxID=290746 RepID=A0A914D8R7_9BILA